MGADVAPARLDFCHGLVDFRGKCMRTLKTLKPGQDGTKELLTRFGPSLLYVRLATTKTVASM